MKEGATQVDSHHPTEAVNGGESAKSPVSLEAAPQNNGQSAPTHSRADKQEYFEQQRLVAHRDDQLGNSFRMLRFQVLAKMRAMNARNLAIVGAVPGVGKTMIATNLALSISRDVRQTSVLVDMDMRRPSVCKYFGIEPEYSLADYLSGNISFDELLVSPGFERLVVLPSRHSPNASTLLTSPMLVNLVSEFQSRYPDRFVVYDLPPILGVADAIALLPLVDCALIVLESGTTTKKEIADMKRLLDGVPIVGAVVNKSKEEANQLKAYEHYFHAEQST